jgi:hypothetical protein
VEKRTKDVFQSKVSATDWDSVRENVLSQDIPTTIFSMPQHVCLYIYVMNISGTRTAKTGKNTQVC